MKIAIVGNGPSLLGKKLGSYIDSCDEVVRFNLFNIGNEYKKDTGTKTTYWCVAIDGILKWMKSFDCSFTNTHPFKHVLCRDIYFEKRVDLRNKFCKKAKLEHIGQYCKSAERLSKALVGSWPSNGFLAITHFIVNQPEAEIKIAGFSKVYNNYKKYYQMNFENKCNAHNFEVEALIISSMEINGAIERIDF